MRFYVKNARNWLATPAKRKVNLMLKMDETQRAGILNAIETVANKTVAPQVVEILEASEDLTAITAESLIEAGISKTAANAVAGALELHTQLSSVSVRKEREKRPSIAERYEQETTVKERNSVAVQVAEQRINAEGSKPKAWRKIRESLGLKNDQFHKVVRKSDGWLEACVDRISQLEARAGGWEYSGKLDVLTGINNFELNRKRLEEDREEENKVNGQLALPAPQE